MQWASVTAREAIERLKRGALALDVRSPGEFDHGSADIQLVLVKHGDAWQVRRFQVNSKTFLTQ